MKFTKSLNMDLDIKMTKSVQAKQNDKNSRFLNITLYNQGQLMDLENYKVKLYAIKPDGKEVFNNCTIENNNVIVPLTGQLLAVEGAVKCELMILDSSNDYITSKIFTLEVERCLSKSNAVESINEFNVIVGLLNDLEQAKEQLNIIGSINATLLGNIDGAKAWNSTLETTINSANTKNTELKTSISNANTSKTALDKSKANADSTKTALDSAIAKVGSTDLILKGDYEVGSNGVVKDISNQDIRLISKSGLYRGLNCINAPIQGTWYFYNVEVGHTNSTNFYHKVTAYHFASNKTYVCVKNNTTWSAWEEIPTLLNGKFDGAFKTSGILGSEKGLELSKNPTNNKLLQFQIDRGWGFYEYNSGAQSSLMLKSDSNNKSFRIYNQNNKGIDINVDDSNTYLTIPNGGSLKSKLADNITEIEIARVNSNNELVLGKGLPTNTKLYFSVNNDPKSIWHDGMGAKTRPSNRMTSGYEKLPSGLIVQWGVASIGVEPGSQANITVTLPIAFPTFGIGAWSTVNYNNTYGNYSYLDQMISNVNMVGDCKSQILIIAKNLKEAPTPKACTFEVPWFTIGY